MNKEGSNRLFNIIYGLLALVLAVIAIFTHEFVTFLMLGFVVMALVNINNILTKILAQMCKDSEKHSNRPLE